jgi:uncharacterized protein YfaS (alpha-2-macroglobulin family)
MSQNQDLRRADISYQPPVEMPGVQRSVFRMQSERLAALERNRALAMESLNVVHDRLIRMHFSTAAHGSHARVAITMLCDAIAALSTSEGSGGEQ